MARRIAALQVPVKIKAKKVRKQASALRAPGWRELLTLM
jgi:hypothetical protein